MDFVIAWNARLFVKLSREKAVFIDYAVEYTGITPTEENIGMLFWTEQPEDITVDSPNAMKAKTLGIDPKNENYYIFKPAPRPPARPSGFRTGLPPRKAGLSGSDKSSFSLL